MNDNLKIWNSLKQPPSTALKTITGGRLSGMTDIKPQWRYQAMTEQFGPCGLGWYYTIDKEWTEEGSEGQVLCFVNASLLVKSGEEWSKPIPGTGGSTLIAKEKHGLHSSDEGFKMALTDALSVAMGKLGVAADIYMGNWTGSKYRDAEVKTSPVNRQPSFEESFGKARKALGDDIFFEICTTYELKSVEDWTGIATNQREEFLDDCRKQVKKGKS
jgi:hypothetical protein